MNKQNRKDQIEELFKNQTYILDAVKNLNERLEAIEEKIDTGKIDDIKDILDSQVMIDAIIVKNSDDITVMKKVKEENGDAIKMLETKIDLLDQEIQKRNEEIQNLNKHEHKENEEKIENKQIMCKYYNRGYCKNKTRCRYVHPQNVCKIFLKDGKCCVRDCSSRHPKKCKYFKQGCNRGDRCAYLHNASDQIEGKLNNSNDKTDKKTVDHDENDVLVNETKVDSSVIGDNEINVEC